jgi:hypothetical protein
MKWRLISEPTKSFSFVEALKKNAPNPSPPVTRGRKTNRTKMLMKQKQMFNWDVRQLLAFPRLERGVREIMNKILCFCIYLCNQFVRIYPCTQEIGISCPCRKIHLISPLSFEGRKEICKMPKFAEDSMNQHHVIF